MNEIVHSTIKPFIAEFLQQLATRYWTPLYQYVKYNPHLIKTMPGFLLQHQKILIYVGRTHIAIEYNGSELLEELPSEYRIEVQYFDYSVNECNLFEMIIGSSMIQRLILIFLFRHSAKIYSFQQTKVMIN